MSAKYSVCKFGLLDLPGRGGERGGAEDFPFFFLRTSTVSPHLTPPSGVGLATQIFVGTNVATSLFA